MGPLAQFLIALTNLVRSGAIRKIPQAIKFAEQQFGKVTPLLKKQIEKVFDSAKKPVVGKPGKKEGAVIPMVRETVRKGADKIKSEEGIASLEDSSPLMDRLDETVDMLQNNPRRPGGSLDPATGLTRALARRILDRKGIEIGKKDPIEVFSDTFGESINDVNNLAEEMLEIDARGGGMKDMDQMLEADGLFDIEIPTNPQRGLTDEEMLQLDKQVKEDQNLEQLEGLGATKLAERFRLKKKYPGIDDELLTNIIEDADPQHKAEVLGRLDEAFEMMSQGKGPDEIIDIFEMLKKTRKDNATGGRVQLANGSYGSYKDFIESTGDEELMELYAEGLNIGDFTKLFEALKRKGYSGRDDNATGGRVQAAGGGLADLLKLK